MATILGNNYVRFCIAFIIGIIVGSYFYPEKVVVKEVEIESERQNKLISELQGQVKSLEKEKKKIHTVIVSKPGGETITTIIEESEKTKELLSQYESKIIEKDKEISLLKDKYKEETNKKINTVEIGYLVDKSIYAHGSRVLFGPLLIGLHVQFGNNNNLGAGIGFKF